MIRYPPVESLLPHSAPMVLLDEVTGWEGERLTARVAIREDSMFLQEGRVPAVVAVEYMAQAIGAFGGLDARRQGEPVTIGYLLGSRDLRLEVDAFEPGDVLDVAVERVFGGGELASFQCSVSRAGAEVARGTLSVFRTQDEQEPS